MPYLAYSLQKAGTAMKSNKSQHFHNSQDLENKCLSAQWNSVKE